MAAARPGISTGAMMVCDVASVRPRFLWEHQPTVDKELVWRVGARLSTLGEWGSNRFGFLLPPASGTVPDMQRVHKTALPRKQVLDKLTRSQEWTWSLPRNHGFPDAHLCGLTQGDCWPCHGHVPGEGWQTTSPRQQQRSLGVSSLHNYSFLGPHLWVGGRKDGNRVIERDPHGWFLFGWSVFSKEKFVKTDRWNFWDTFCSLARML